MILQNAYRILLANLLINTNCFITNTINNIVNKNFNLDKITVDRYFKSRIIVMLDSNSNSNDTFPSFNKFIENKTNNEKQMEMYIDKIIEKENQNVVLPITHSMRLLTSNITLEWSKNWIYDMVNIDSDFPQFMYQDMFLMNEYSKKNINPLYYYIGYYPRSITQRDGPYYIAALKLIPEKSRLTTNIIIQNPNHIVDYGHNDAYLVNFKLEIENMCKHANISFSFDELKQLKNKRYYYTWLYNM